MLAEVLWVVTAYCQGEVTKAGTRPVAGHTVAADPAFLPIGSLVEVDGWPGLRQVHDTGPLVKGRHLDIYVDSCREATKWGRQKRQVTIKRRAR
jgi:3D (Asp-Asp-Asp) domain-containing protein